MKKHETNDDKWLHPFLRAVGICNEMKAGRNAGDVEKQEFFYNNIISRREAMRTLPAQN